MVGATVPGDPGQSAAARRSLAWRRFAGVHREAAAGEGATGGGAGLGRPRRAAARSPAPPTHLHVDLTAFRKAGRRWCGPARQRQKRALGRLAAG